MVALASKLPSLDARSPLGRRRRLRTPALMVAAVEENLDSRNAGEAGSEVAIERQLCSPNNHEQQFGHGRSATGTTSMSGPVGRECALLLAHVVSRPL